MDDEGQRDVDARQRKKAGMFGKTKMSVVDSKKDKAALSLPTKNSESCSKAI